MGRIRHSASVKGSALIARFSGVYRASIARLSRIYRIRSRIDVESMRLPVRR
jgi:hypothetical protein